MRHITLHDLGDAVRFSYVLNEALNRLRKSHLRLTANHICQLSNLDAADLSRMRRLHDYPKYKASVSRYKLWKILLYLMEQFPTLVILEGKKGKISVRLYKRYQGCKLMKSLDSLAPLPRPFRSRRRKNSKFIS